MSFQATYPGTCGCCNGRFEKGEEITFTDLDGLVIASHLRTKKVRPICPKCNMELPVSGVCGTCD